MEKFKTQKMRAIFSLIAATICFGCMPPMLRSFTNLDIWTVNGFRYPFAALVWLPYLIAVFLIPKKDRDNSTTLKDSNKVWLYAIPPTLINICGQIGWGLCPYYNDANVIGFVIKTTILFTILLGFIFVPSERKLVKNPWFIAGTTGCLIGIIIMSISKLNSLGNASVYGVLLIVMTAAFWGAYGVAVRVWMIQFPVRLSFGVICLYTAIPLFILMLWRGDYTTLFQIPMKQQGLLILSSLMGIAFGHIFLYQTIYVLGPILSGSLLMSTAFVTYLVSWFFLNETFTPLQWLGGIMLVIGSLLLYGAAGLVKNQSKSV